MLISRLRALTLAGAAAGALSILPACSRGANDLGYEEAQRRTWRTADFAPADHAALMLELVRCATLAPSSHNTQCWKFRIGARSVTLLPDMARRCAAVDPDDHHLFVSLGCATENMIHAARAHGPMADARFDASGRGWHRGVVRPDEGDGVDTVRRDRAAAVHTNRLRRASRVHGGTETAGGSRHRRRYCS